MESLFLKRAEENMPRIFESTVTPSVNVEPLVPGDEFVIDMKNHYVGYFSFNMDYVDVYIDAPVRLYIRFCETERELHYDYSAYEEGLCRSWLQEEIINIDFPGEYKMPRRYAARYILIRVVASPKNFVCPIFTSRRLQAPM